MLNIGDKEVQKAKMPTHKLSGFFIFRTKIVPAKVGFNPIDLLQKVVKIVVDYYLIKTF